MAQRLPGDRQRFPAGGEDPQLRQPVEQLIGELRGRFDEMLAVVQHQHRLADVEQLGHPVERRGLLHLPSVGKAAVPGAERAEHRVGQLIRRAHPGQRHEPHPAALISPMPGHRLQGQPGLARATGPDDGDQPGGGHQLGELLQLAVPADEAGQLRREPARCGLGLAPRAGPARRGAGRDGSPAARPRDRRRAPRSACSASPRTPPARPTGVPPPTAHASAARPAARSAGVPRPPLQDRPAPRRAGPAAVPRRSGPRRPRPARSSSLAAETRANGASSTSASAAPRHSPSAVAEHRRRLFGPARRQLAPALPGQLLEPVHVHVLGAAPTAGSRRPPRSTVPAPRSALRSRDTNACSALAAPDGGSAPHRPSMSESTDTGTTRLQGEPGQQHAQPGTADIDRRRVIKIGFNRTKQGNPHHGSLPESPSAHQRRLARGRGCSSLGVWEGEATAFLEDGPT